MWFVQCIHSAIFDMVSFTGRMRLCIQWNLAILATLETGKTGWISEVAGSQRTIGLQNWLTWDLQNWLL